MALTPASLLGSFANYNAMTDAPLPGSVGNKTGAAPYQPSNLPIPGADQYASAAVLANNAYDKALAQINQNRMNTLTNYGYTGTVDPTSGAVTNVRIDPNSIYGTAQTLFHNQAVDDRNAQFAAQDRGLFGGLAHQAASELHYQHGGERSALGQNLLDQLSGFDTQQQSASESKNNALWQAQQAALDAEMQSEYNQSIQDLLNQILSGSGGGGGGGGGGGAVTNPIAAMPGNPYNAAANPGEGNLYGSLDPGLASTIVNSELLPAAKQKALQQLYNGVRGPSIVAFK